MLEEYYNRLGVSEKASIQDIKHAFRKKAKELHPDINKGADAQASFVKLLEAYEYLIDYKSGRTNAKSSHFSTYTSYVRWQDNAEERARRRAEYMRTHAEQQRKNKAADAKVGIAALVYCLFIVFIMPLISFWQYGKNGFISSIIMLICFYPLLMDTYKTARKTPVTEYPAWLQFIFSRKFTLSVLSLLNAFIFLKVVLATLIPLKIFFSILLQLSVLVFLFIHLYKKKTVKEAMKWTFVYFPLFFQLFFVINFLYSSDQQFEKYEFAMEKNPPLFPSPAFSILKLPADQYEEFFGMRMVFNKNIEDKKQINYIFEKGLFGIRVVKGCFFE